MQTMYPAVVNSPKTELVVAITETDTEIEVADVSVLLQPEGLAVIGNGEGAETIKYTEVEGNLLKNCIRGFQGTAKPWGAGTRLARNFTAYDHDAFMSNIEQHDTAINALEDRLNTADTQPVTLQPGLQVVDAAKDARFNLGRIEGKTEINYGGRIGLIGVENPYVTRYGENLLPPFYEWTNANGGDLTINGLYDATLVRNGPGQSLRIEVPTIPGQIYTLSLASPNPAYVSLHFYDSSGALVSSPVNGLENTPVSATAPNNSAYVRVVLGGEIGTYNFKNPMLTLGSGPRPFKPREDSMLAFQTELHANPSDGSNPDVLFEREGQYFKLAKWKKIKLDGSLEFVPSSRLSGYMKVKLTTNIGAIGGYATGGYATKYNGNMLTTKPDVDIDGADQISFTDYARLTISNTESGWGDNYTPTSDEIKAYFMGWKMYESNTGRTETYNGTGTKAWYPITRLTDTLDLSYRVLTNVPTTLANNKDTWKPYQLLYRLAKEVVEPVPFEGSLVLPEGKSVVEVGTGIILREQANPLPDVYGNYYINSSFSGYEQTRLKYKVEDIKNVYNDGKDVSFIRDTLDAWGNVRAKFYDYDPSTPYTVTYIKLDKSPIQPITGVVSNNEKAQISDLTAAVAEALQRVSVVEMKKAEKDAPGWITPTLLNGWTNYGGATNPVGYYKDASGLVHLRGVARPGTMGVAMFSFITECRPKSQFNLGTVGDAGNGSKVPAQVGINTTGELIPASTATTWVSLDGLSFPV